MKKFRKTLSRIGVLCLVCVMAFLMSMCAKDKPSDTTAPTEGAPITYTVTVKSQGGLPLSGVGVYVYTDSTHSELVWFARTDDAGVITFTAPERSGYVAVLTEVTTGYEVEAEYLLAGANTEIILSAAQLSEDEMKNVVYKLGDMMMDFTVEDAEGNTYTLSKYLETKKAVVLNFWYANCEPCKGEFPYLQEAYDIWKDQIEVIAMNPVDDAEKVEAFRKEMGYTFPMLACDPAWQSMMRISAYPTTVVVDRYGNIVLMHTGAVDTAKTFSDAFEWFASEDYTQKLITNIKDLEKEEPVGTASNPFEIGGVTEFEITVEAGADFHVALFKATDMYLQIRSKDVTVTYNEKTYTPQNGVVGLVVNSPDTYTPANLIVTNKSGEKQTFKVILSSLPGTLNNPHPMQLGELTVQVAAGNEKGVYYSYIATEDGTMKLTCLSATAGVKYGYTLYNLSSYVLRNLESEGETDEQGRNVLTIQAKKGQTIQVIVSTLPDENNQYPAASFRFDAVFEAGEIKEEEKVEQLEYKITVLDTEGNPIPNVRITLTPEVKEDTESEQPEGDAAEGEEELLPVQVSTNAEGIALVELPKGTYFGTFLLPEGYEEVEDPSFTLTEEVTEHTITLTKIVIVIHDYTVTVTDANGAPVAEAKVKIGDTIVTTDAQGKAVFTLEEGSYTVLIQSLPADYMADAEEYSFAEGQTSLNITLALKPGTAGNPYVVASYPYDAPAIDPAGQLHLLLKNAQGMELVIRNEAASIIYGGKTYAPVQGVLSLMLEEAEASLILCNNGQTSLGFTLRTQHPLGAKENPIVLDQLGSITVALKESRPDGCYYSWTAAEDGRVYFTLADYPEDMLPYMVLTVGSSYVGLNDEHAPLTLPVKAGDLVTLQVKDMSGCSGALTVVGRFELPPNSAQYPQIITDIANVPVAIPRGDNDGWFLRWNPANGGVATFRLADNASGDIIITVEGSDTVVKLSDGLTDAQGDPVAAITVARGDVVNICVTAAAPASLTLQGSLTQDSNSAENPAILTDITSFDTTLVTGDPNGHFYLWTADYAGTVTFALDAVTEGVSGSIAIRVGGGAWELMTEGKVTKDVKAGDEVLINVAVQPVAGAYPAAQLNVKGSFVHLLGSSMNPFVADDLSGVSVTLDAGNTDGYHVSWTASGSGNTVFYLTDALVSGAAVAEPADQLELTVFVNGERKAALSENEMKDAEGNRIVTVTLQKGDIVELCVTTRANSHPAASAILRGKQDMNFTVRVTDLQNKLYSNVAVSVFSGSKKVYSGNTDANGSVSFQAASGDYTVELAFEGTAYYYDKAAAVLTSDRPALTIRLANYLDTSKVYTDLWALNGANTYQLPLGSTYVETGTGKSYFCAEQDNNCLFIFHPTEAGTYMFTVDNPNVAISYRSTPYFTFQIETSAGTENNSFTQSIGKNTAGHVDMVIGLTTVEGVSGVTVSITRIGDADLSVEDMPWDEEWKSGHTHNSGCKPSKTTLTYLNINAATGTYDLYYDAAKDVYRLYEGGPILYVDLNSARHGISLYKIINGDGTAGGAPIRRYFYDASGAFLKKEDYTATLEEYFACAGITDVAKTGYHALTADLAYILQNGGAKWWDSTAPDGIDTLITANPEYAWLFLCGYTS